MSPALVVDHGQEFLPGDRVIAEGAGHVACYEIRAGLHDAACRHAVVFCLQHDGHALRLQDVFDRVGNLSRQFFLNLQAFSVRLYNACKFGNANDASIRDVGDPGAADDWGHVVFAVALKPNAAQDDHAVVAVGFFKRLLKNRFGIFRVAFEILFVSTRDARWRFMQPVAIWIFACPEQNRAYGGLDFGAAWLLEIYTLCRSWPVAGFAVVLDDMKARCSCWIRIGFTFDPIGLDRRIGSAGFRFSATLG